MTRRRAVWSSIAVAVTAAVVVTNVWGNAPRYAAADDLPESLAADGTTVLVGAPDAKVTLRVYEDMSCPSAREYETEGAGPGIRTAVLNGEINTEYRLASFLDRDSGDSSKKAANALRAALEQGKFAAFHQVLFASPAPPGGYTDAVLLERAGEVKGLRGHAFDSAVKEMKYAAWVTASERAYEEAGNPGTPTVEVNGHRLKDEDRWVLYEPGTVQAIVTYYR
ncbi:MULTISPECIES: thioredoxin domain-containing protein [unclassified Streptomyces]|uniref:DsbA family protein n=1 Tax=unclassified Streptomyces TaxID=2593676 RepID=UPI001BE554C2|nr:MULTISPECIES: thioredoxin domain-containing protein [unclassified Streptomyces]MBT2402604.1 thioredoxin domain-containing protein [Streptomyces sp. ISL-21]MBT2457204.1 thioredoxin domain-containing protein [Streptomyces sp. ISL-86]MBT2607997.1 thioredoxin domain-containing protein [Streptomyces sp. ISL-87]